jgi:hypothetical protein
MRRSEGFLQQNTYQPTNSNDAPVRVGIASDGGESFAVFLERQRIE